MTQLEKETMELAKRAARKYLYNEVDWEQRRYEIAKEVSVGILQAYWTDENSEIQKFVDDEFENDNSLSRGPDNIIAEVAVDFADALIKQLKGGKPCE